MATTHILSLNADLLSRIEQFPQTFSLVLRNAIANPNAGNLDDLSAFGVTWQGCSMSGATYAMRFILDGESQCDCCRKSQ